MEIGDIILARPMLGGETGESEGKLQRGVVVYIHPKGRFYTLEFTSQVTGERFRECFYPQRAPAPDPEERGVRNRPHFYTKKKYGEPLYG